MRMEIPGMALFDREGREIYGISLQEAKKKAKNNYPIAPQLDVCRPLVGQETVPDFNAVTNPPIKYCRRSAYSSTDFAMVGTSEA